MRHRIAGRKLNRPTSHRMLMLRNQVTQLIKHERIVTTEAKAKETSRLAEHAITLGKKGSLHHRRQALSMIMEKPVAHKLFDDLAERYASRAGGYTRILSYSHEKAMEHPWLCLNWYKKWQSKAKCIQRPQATIKKTRA